MEIKYKSLRMQNFKCFKDQTIEFGNKTQIKAMNGKGKSTIADAINFVLFNTLADGTKADKIRPHDATGKDIDMIEITVTLDMEVDGKPINIVKTQKQNWVKHRGNTEATYEGNVNTYVVNTIPKAEKDYKSYMAELIDEKLFRMTTSANDFLKMKTVDKRNTLFELVSDMTDADVISTNPKFGPIASELEKYKLDEIISRAKKAVSDNNKELSEIPSRIDTANNLKSDVDVAELELQKNALKEQIADAERKLADATKDDTVSKLSNEIMQMQFKISDYKKSKNEKLFAQQKDAQAKVDALETELRRVVSERTKISAQQVAINDEVATLKDKIYAVGEQYKSEDAKEFAESRYVFDERKTICPVCGREYESDKIEQMKSDFEKHKEADRQSFEKSKKESLDSINNVGCEINSKLISLTNELHELNVEYENVKKQYETTFSSKNEAVKELESLPKEVDLSADQELASMESQLANMNNQYEQLKNIDNPSKELEAQKSALQTELSNVEKSIVAADNSKIDEEIARLTDRQKELGQLIANAERELNLYEEFNRAKMRLLTDEINKHFSLIKWELWEKQQNGGIKDICEPTIDGTYYSKGLNTGNRILAELDIISTIQKLHGVVIPAIVDNSEQLDSKSLSSIKADFQQIYLRVTDDAEMVVESEV